MPCTREAWREVTEAESTVGTIDRARECLARGDRKGYDKLKRSLPLVCFMATFTPNRGSKGTSAEAPWRSQKHAVLNGLVMMDIDHVSQPTPDPSRGGGEVEPLTPVKLFMKIPDHMFDEKTCPTPILLVHVTPSGDGLRIVFKADPNRGNISDNQHYMASALGVTCDEACKDASRGSGLSSREIAKDSDTWCGLQVSCRIWTRKGPQLRLTASLPTLARSREDMLSVRSCKPSLRVLVIGETTPTGRERLAKSLATPAASSGADFEIVWENPIPKPYKE